MRWKSSAVSARVPGLTYNNPQKTTGSLVDPASADKQKGMRLDVEYRLGQHSLRGGRVLGLRSAAQAERGGD